MDGDWFDPEAVAAERLDADQEMGELEAAGRHAARRLTRARVLFEAGRLMEAAQTCPHGWRQGLPGEKSRCLDCGSLLGWSGKVLAPCEMPTARSWGAR